MGAMMRRDESNLTLMLIVGITAKIVRCLAAEMKREQERA